MSKSPIFVPGEWSGVPYGPDDDEESGIMMSKGYGRHEQGAREGRCNMCCICRQVTKGFSFFCLFLSSETNSLALSVQVMFTHAQHNVQQATRMTLFSFLRKEKVSDVYLYM